MIETVVKSKEINQNATGLKIPVNIQGIGFRVPDRVVTNEELKEDLGLSDKWIHTKTGIKERRYLEDHLVTSDLCVFASEGALMDAGIKAEDVDVIIITTTTPDQRSPSTAMVVKEKLGAKKAIPIDLNQTACTGGIYSMYLGSHLLQSDHVNNVLIIGCEVLSRIMAPNDKRTRTFFGDAAGAMVLQKTSENRGGLLSMDLDFDLDYAVQIPGGGTVPIPEGLDDRTSQYVQMDGKRVWEVATKVVPISIRKAIKEAGLDVEDIDHFILHQANLNIIKKVMEDLDLPLSKTTISIEEYANTGSATLFSGLYKALKENKISEGDNIVFSAIGAGFLWGSACFKYTKN